MNQTTETPDFFKVGNIFVLISGWLLVGIATITPFVYGTFFNYQGMVSYTIGIIFLYWNYKFVKKAQQYLDKVGGK